MLSIYIRFLTQALQHLLLTSILEIYRAEFMTTYNSFVSYLVAVAILVLSIIIVLIIVFSYYWRAVDANPSKVNMFKELYLGLKTTPSAGLYPLMVIFRRVIFVTWLVCFEWLHVEVIVSLMIVVQGVCLLLIALLKPYKTVKDNLFEFVNQLIYAIILSILILFNGTDWWSTLVTTACVWLMMFPSYLLTILTLSKLISSYF